MEVGSSLHPSSKGINIKGCQGYTLKGVQLIGQVDSEAVAGNVKIH